MSEHEVRDTGTERLSDTVTSGDMARTSELARARRALPGPFYYYTLAWIHEALAPPTYVEIGIRAGDSLRIAGSDTVALGIDPHPIVTRILPATTRVFAMTSDAFFADYNLHEVLRSDRFSLAFIDGLHLFEQVLLDFMNLEAYAGRDSVIILHDCMPLDQVTAARTRTTAFYSGDVWKAVLCLREQRPDLQMTMVPAAPTGLCIVSGLDNQSRVLRKNFDALVARYMPLDFDDYTMRIHQMPGRISNNATAVKAYVSGLLTPGA